MSDPRRMQSTTSQRQPTSGPRETISFACGGWLKMYEFGVAKALQEVGVDRNMNVIGCSAGALAATALALECNLEDIRDYVIGKLVHRARDLWSGPFKVREYCAETLDACANLERVHRLKSDPEKLTIVYSSLSAWTSRRVSQFDSPEHLKMSLLASTCAVPIGGMPFKLNGEWVMDGGLFDFQPVFDKKTITVSPFFCMAADIKPSRYVPMWWAVYAPSQRDVEWLFDLGYEDGLRWIVESGRAQGKHIKIPTKGATYDGEWTTTVGRVIGYRGLESRVLDVLFVAMFVILWKPIAFSLLYTELCLQAIMAGSKAVLFAAASKLSVASIVMGASVVALLIHNAVETMPAVFSLMAVGLVLCVCAFVAGGMQEAASLAAKDWQKCCTCVRSIASLSLFLRSMPVVGSTIKIKRHDHLVEHSLVYRVALHFV